MSNNTYPPNRFEILTAQNRGGSFVELAPEKRVMWSLFKKGLGAIRELELNDDVQDLMSGRVVQKINEQRAEKLELTADNTAPIETEVIVKPEIVPVSGLPDLSEIRKEVDRTSESRVIHLPPEAETGDFDERLHLGA